MEVLKIDIRDDLEILKERLSDGSKKTARCMVAIPLINMIQLRNAISQETVKKYAAAMNESASMPPACGNVDFDAMEVYCFDGGHRKAAAELNGATHLLMELSPGTKRDATLNAAGVNEEHGLARAKDDKRNSVETILADSEWRCRSSSWIAQVTHTSVPNVEQLRKKADKQARMDGGGSTMPTKRVVKRYGKEYEMTIPTKRAKDPVDVILGKLVKMAKNLEEADRSRLLKAITDTLGNNVA